MCLLSHRLTLWRAIKDSVLHAECRQYAMAVGGFAGTWKLVNNSLRIRNRFPHRVNGAIAGATAAVWLTWLPVGTQKSFSVQMFLRALQLLYNYHKEKSKLSLPHGDVALFAVSCSQIMYAFMLRPSTIPKSYYSWTLNISNSHVTVLDANRKLARSGGRWANIYDNIYDLVSLCGAVGGSSKAISHCKAYIDSCQETNSRVVVPCSLVHCRDINCLRYNLWLFARVVCKMLPVNLAINLAPQMLLKFGAFLKEPKLTLEKSIKSSAQSSIFLAFFISFFNSLVCLQRSLLISNSTSAFLHSPTGHKIWYHVSGGLAALLSILMEQKRKRGELALYVFPKAMESFYLTLLHRKSLKRPIHPKAHYFLSMLAFGILMAWYQDGENSREHMNPTVYRVMKHLVGEN